MTHPDPLEQLENQLQVLITQLGPGHPPLELPAVLQSLDALKSTTAADHARTRAEQDTLKAEMHAELVDREANAARVQERQRFLFERSTSLPGQSTAADRAIGAVHHIEAALVALCPHNAPRFTGCDQLAEAATE